MRISILFLIALTVFSSCSDKELMEPSVENCNFTELEQDIISELNIEHVNAFESAEPTVPEKSLDRLIDYLGDAKVVGLGEATHGSAEFFKMKDKIFRSLVKDKDFKAIVFEIPWGNCLIVNDYVINNKGTANEALNQTYYWVFDTQETRDLAIWMNEYNESKDSLDKIYFVGCDPQGGNFEIEKEVVFRYLNKYAPVLKDSVYLRYINLPFDLSNYSDLSHKEQNSNKENVDWVYRCLEEKREAFVNLSGGYEYEIALMATHVIKHRELIYRRQTFGQTRDSLMAVYSLWWQDILGPSAKIAVWAHNNHVMDNSSSSSSPWMGAYLRLQLGIKYRNLGFSFTTGSLNAFVANQNGNFLSGVKTQFVPEVVCHSLNYLLSQMDADQYYIIFGQMDHNSSAREYLYNDHRFYQMGAGFNRSFMHNYTSTLSFPNRWDVMVHFDRVNFSELK